MSPGLSAGPLELKWPVPNLRSGYGSDIWSVPKVSSWKFNKGDQYDNTIHNQKK
jgi:hypothetical protein